MKKKKWYVAMATALLLAAGCSDDLDNGKNNTGAEEDGEKVYMTVNVSTVSQGTLTKADPTPSNPNSGGAGWGEDGNGSLGELSGSKEGMVYDVNIFLVPTDEESLGDGNQLELLNTDNGSSIQIAGQGYYSNLEGIDASLGGTEPGHGDGKVTMKVTDDNALSIAYEAVSDQTTVANFTNHAYFNLNGHDSGCMENQELEILASYYTPVKDGEAIPTGNVEKVAGTPMDFRKMKKIGQDIGVDFEQLKFVGGYDHNFVLDKADGTMQLAARARSEKSGICMDVYTDCVGIQLYAGNFIGKQTGKGGASYDSRHAFCLETQYFPNAVNEPNFKSPVLHVGETYHSQTKYCFSVK